LINLVQGETKPIEITVYLVDGVTEANLTGGKAIFSYQSFLKSEDAIFIDCTIATSLVSCTLTSTQTSILKGEYNCEIKYEDSDGKISVVYMAKMYVYPSIMPVFANAE